jgi:hypothetical protein
MSHPLRNEYQPLRCTAVYPEVNRFIRDHCLFKASHEIADITTALNATFNQALGTAHIPN